MKSYLDTWSAVLFVLLVFLVCALNTSCSRKGDVFSDEEEYYESLKKDLLKNGFPNIQFKDMSGDVFDIKSLKGKPVLINYWAFGCAPCFKEMPDLSNLADKYNGSAAFISVIAPGNPNILSDNLQKKLKELRFNYRHVASEKEFSTYGFLEVYPLHIVLDKEGNLVELFTGVNHELLEKKIVELL